MTLFLPILENYVNETTIKSKNMVVKKFISGTKGSGKITPKQKLFLHFLD